MSLILYRVMRTCLHASASSLSPERALPNQHRIQHQRVTLNGADTIAGVSAINDEQSRIFTAVTIKKPL